MAHDTKNIVKVSVKNVPQAPQKLRLVADLVRGADVVNALNTLEFLNKKGALFVKKAILSGVANASDLYQANKEALVVSTIFVDEGSKTRKYRFASRGRVARLLRRKSHLYLELSVR